MGEDIRSVVLDRMPALEKTKESKKQNMGIYYFLFLFLF